MHRHAIRLAPTLRNMLHLHTERLAELGDDTLTPEEAAHLASGEVCAHERSAYQTLVAMALAEREPFGLPLTRWDAITAELSLKAEAPVADIAPARRSKRWMLQIAAGLLLVAGGAMLGRVSAGARVLPDSAATQTASVGSSSDVTQPVAQQRIEVVRTRSARVEQTDSTERQLRRVYRQIDSLARVYNDHDELTMAERQRVEEELGRTVSRVAEISARMNLAQDRMMRLGDQIRIQMAPQMAERAAASMSRALMQVREAEQARPRAPP